MKAHYDGPYDYNSIYWFAKGLQLPIYHHLSQQEDISIHQIMQKMQQ